MGKSFLFTRGTRFCLTTHQPKYRAIADLAQRLSIPASRINTMEARGVFWSDASLGCPQPDTTYTQVLTPGYLILLESGGNKFEYHANLHDHVFYCEKPTPPILETPANP